MSLVYKEETTANAGSSKGKGTIEIPERFTLRLAPFIGAAPVEITARFRYRIEDGRLLLNYKMQRPDIAEKEAFDALVTQIGENTPRACRCCSVPPRRRCGADGLIVRWVGRWGAPRSSHSVGGRACWGAGSGRRRVSGRGVACRCGVWSGCVADWADIGAQEALTVSQNKP